MNVSFVPDDALRTSGELVTLALFDSDLASRALAPALSALDEQLEGHLRKASAEEGFKAKADQSFVLHTHGKVKASRLMLVGLGARDRFRMETLRLAAGRVAKMAQK